jgi:sigma-B regulation protein RsbU (phosphoserine phosphatase)
MVRQSFDSANITGDLRQQLLQREAELDILTSVQLGLAQRLDVQAVYDLVGDKIREIFNPDVVMLSTYDPESNTVEHRYAIEMGERIYAPGHLPPGGFRAKIIETHKSVLVNTNVAELAAQLGQPTLPGTVTPKSWLGAPMLVRGQVTGILSLQSISKENAFKQTDVRILETLAASMSVALENARMWEQEKQSRQSLEHEFEVGRNIQAGFLPETLPQPAGWEIAASLKPAREVAGDFYDVFRLGEGKVGLVIADVCDKGLGAALFMTLVRSLLRAVANLDSYSDLRSRVRHTSERRLQEAVQLTNNYLEENHGMTGMFATVFIAILDIHTGVLKYINCGHLPPCLVHVDNSLTKLTATGPALGAIRRPQHEVGEASLEQGELLFMFTDGVSDAENAAGKKLGEEGLQRLLHHEDCPAELIDRLTATLAQFTRGVKQFDDMTMLVVRRFG